MKSIIIIMSLFLTFFLGCQEKKALSLDTNKTLIEKNIDKTPEKEDIFKEILANSINSLDELESEIDRMTTVLSQISPDEDILKNESFESRNIEYKKKLESIMSVIYKLHNSSLEFKNKKEFKNPKVNGKLKKLMQDYDDLLANSKKFKIKIEKYRDKLSKLRKLEQVQKTEAKAAKSMFSEIEIGD